MVSLSDPDADQTTVILVDDTSHGELTLDSSGSFTYTPEPDFVGTDTFTFKANDGVDDSNVATFEIHVQNTAPTASNGSETIHRNTILSSMVSFNDTDGDPTTVSLVEGTTHGELVLYASGSYTYEPDWDFVGTDSFTFKANDGLLDSNVKTIEIHVTNAAPFAVGEHLSIMVGGEFWWWVCSTTTVTSTGTRFRYQLSRNLLTEPSRNRGIR